MYIVTADRIIKTTLTETNQISQFAESSLGLSSGDYQVLDDSQLAESPQGQAAALESQRVALLQAIEAAFTSAIQRLVGQYPDAEQKTWYIQEQEARAWLADNAATVPFITTLASAEGVSLTQKAVAIVTKADAYRGALAQAIGLRHQLRGEASAGLTTEVIEQRFAEVLPQ